MTTTFTNRHLSYSRLQRFEQCPQSFKLHYIDRLPSEPGVELKFGKAVHWALEQLVSEHALDGKVEPLSIDHALDLWQVAWTNEGLTGVGLFGEGAELLKAFCRSEGLVDPRDVVAVERSFEITVGRFRVVGAIDRVDRIDDFTIRVRDYKSNRLVFTRDEVAESLQPRRRLAHASRTTTSATGSQTSRRASSILGAPALWREGRGTTETMPPRSIEVRAACVFSIGGGHRPVHQHP